VRIDWMRAICVFTLFVCVSTIAAQDCPHDCSGHGVCVKDPASPFPPYCACSKRWSGRDCSIGSCLHNCSFSGTCDTTTGTCNCNTGMTGADCSKKAERVAPCDFGCVNGDCISGRCMCYKGWIGAACDVETCHNNCSGNGICWEVWTGMFQCACQEGYAGNSCEIPAHSCPDSCSSHGKCDATNGLCTCDRGFKPPNCALRECELGYLNQLGPHPPPLGLCPNDCSCRGYCVCDDGNCFCACEPSWAGADCSVPIGV